MKARQRLLLHLFLVLILSLSALPLQAARGDNAPPSPLTPTVGYATRMDISPALRDMPRLPRVEGADARPESDFVLPKARAWDAPASPDPVLQSVTGPLAMPAPLTSFDGIGNVNGMHPPDTQGDIGYDPATGTKYYVQWVNLSFAIWDVTGTPTQVYGPVNGNTLWQGFGGVCETTNHGDPITLFDTLANRWMMSQFSINGPYYQCIAISQTADPTGKWYRYAFLVSPNKMNDYPHFGVWPDGYYMTVNQFLNGASWSGAGVFVFERDKMLVGDPTASFQYFDLYNVNSNYGGMLPSDLDGANLPPAGAPNYFMEVDDSTWIGPNDAMRIWEFHVDWTNPANTTFGINGQPNVVIPTASWTPISTNVPQPGTSARLDTIGDRLMYRLAYRNFGTHESLVVNHTVNAGSGVAGVRWYEIRDPNGTPVIYQQGTYSPDSNSRWMASVAMDMVGNIAVGYSVSSSSVYPSVRYAGRTPADPLGTLPQAEATLVNGSGYQTSSYERWGDYSMLGIDPVDDCTFWFTEEYMATSGYSPWSTRIGSFRFPNCVSADPGTLRGVVEDAISAAPVTGAMVEALTASGTGGDTFSGPDGTYALLLDAGTYTVTASAYGYLPYTETDVDVTSTATTTLDFLLTSAPTYVVSGTVTDALTGWPLYARVSVTGDPFSPPAPDNAVWSDPMTGFYSLTLASGITYTFDVAAWVAGYVPASASIGPLAADETDDFALNADLTACIAPGYVANRTGVEESFDAGVLLSGWTLVDDAGDGVLWRFDDLRSRGNLTGGIGPFAIIDSDAAGTLNVDAALRSPSFDFSTAPAVVVLEFKYDFRWYAFSQDEGADVDVSNDGGGSWTNIWQRAGGSDRGPKTAQVDISALAAGESDVRVRFRYYDANYEYWWQVDDISIGSMECTPAPGGLMVGEVFDANTGMAVEASLANDAGYATTARTLDAPGDGAFYTLFAPTGTHALTATAASYAPEIVNVDVVSGTAVRQKVYLEAGLLDVTPTSLAITLTAGTSATLPITLSNSGGFDADFEVQEIDAPYSALSATGPFAGMVRRVSPKHLHDLTAATVREYYPPDVPLLAAGTVIQTWDSGLASPWGVAFDTASGVLWLGDTKLGGGADVNAGFLPDGTVTGAALSTSPWVSVFAADVAYNPVTGMLWQVNVGGDNCIYELDPAAQTATGRTLCPPFGVSERGLAYDPVTDTFYSGSWNDQILYHFDARGRLLDSIDLRLNIAGLAYNPATRHLFVMSSNADVGYDVYVVDVADGYAITGGFDIAGLGALEQAGLSLDCDGSLWTVNQATGQVIQVVSGETGICAWEEIDWLSTDPVSGTVSIAGEQVVDIHVDATGMGGGVYPAHLRIANSTPYGELNVPITLTVVLAHDVTLTPPTTMEGGVPGTPVTYTFTVTNTGQETDAFTVTLSGDDWPASAPVAIGPLAGGASAPLDIAVTVPADTLCGASDVATVTVTSQGDPAYEAAAVMTTTADAVYSVAVAPADIALAGDPGDAVSASVWVTNTGNCVDTFVLAATGLWSLEVAPTTSALASGASVAMPFTVTVPGDALAGADDLATLTATSQSDGAASASVVVTTTANTVYGVMLTPASAEGSAKPGEVATYALTLTNAGNITDTVTLSLNGVTWTSTITPETVLLDAGSAALLTVTVTVPEHATSGMTDVVQAMATGTGVSASSALTTTVGCIAVEGAGFNYEPASPLSGQTVTFTGSVVTGTAPIAYTWDFGDGGALATGAVVTRTFTAQTVLMPYTVVMTATNTCSSGVAEQIVTVQMRMIYLPLVMRAE